MFYRLFWCFSRDSSTSASQTTGSHHQSLVVAPPSGPAACWLGFLNGSQNMQRGNTTRFGNDTAEIPREPGTSTRISDQKLKIRKRRWKNRPKNRCLQQTSQPGYPTVNTKMKVPMNLQPGRPLRVRTEICVKLRLYMKDRLTPRDGRGGEGVRRPSEHSAIFKSPGFKKIILVIIILVTL